MKCKSCTIDKKIYAICEDEFLYFFNKPNVVAIGLGYKFKKGFYTNKKCIKIFVSNKVLCEKLNSHQIIPKLYKGIPTDVVESGEIFSCSLTKRIRPVIGGYGISILGGDEFGSLGCVVTDGYKKYFLSSNHVIAKENKAAIGTPITQPSFDKGGYTQDIIGYLSKFAPLGFITRRSTPVNYADCAVAELKDPGIVSESIAYVGKPKGIGTVQLHQDVQKIGQTTGRTLGYIESIGVTMKATYKSGTAYFERQIVTNKITKSGDSGGLLLDKSGYVLGILCSQTKSQSFFNPIDLTLSLLNVHLPIN